MTTKNKKIILWVGIPVTLGLYFIYLQIKRGNTKKVSTNTLEKLKEEVNTTPVSTASSNSSNCSYPIKKGSGSSAPCKVVSLLQSALNASPKKFPNKPLAVDGDFGSKTEAALQAVYNKSTIDNAADFDNLLNAIKHEWEIISVISIFK